MEWNWENLDIFSSKKLQSTDDIDESFNLSGVVGGSSSEVASTESSFKNVVKVSNLSFERSGKKKDSSMEASVCSSDQSIGLKLGKRTYFENNNLPRTHTKTSSSSEIPESSVSTMKKVKFSSSQNTPISRCQVEGCNLDLSSSKEYHRKHRVCENHSKSLKVVVGGLERRFCQQCSRFHGLSEFDGKKRSCRRRLSDHNARRRKPQQETIQFNSRTLSSSLYDGREQLSFVFDNLPLVQTKPTGSHYLNDVSMPFNRIMSSSKGTTAGVYDQEALDLRRALSLLSNDSWGSCDPDLSVLHHPMPQGLPLHPPEYMWQVDQPLTHPHTQESHLLKSPYVIQYGNPMDEILKPL